MGTITPLLLAWIFLIIAGIFETVWMISLKQSDGFQNVFPTAVFIISSLASFFFLSQALKQIPIGTSYAVWTGIGMVGTVMLGILWYKEPATLPRMLCILMIAIGVLGLKFYDSR